MEEFFKQGDEERVRGMKVSPMFDRSDTCVPQMQANFIEFIVGPLTVSLTHSQKASQKHLECILKTFQKHLKNI